MSYVLYYIMGIELLRSLPSIEVQVYVSFSVLSFCLNKPRSVSVYIPKQPVRLVVYTVTL